MGSRIPFEDDENKNSNIVFVFRPHPEKNDVMQKFCVTLEKGKRKKSSIEQGKFIGNYRPALEGEKCDCNIYSPKDFMSKPYVKMETKD